MPAKSSRQNTGIEIDRRGGRSVVDVSYAPYFHATAKLLRDVAAAAFASGMHKSARARLVAKVDALTRHAEAWQGGTTNQARFKARFAGEVLASSVPDLQDGVAWAAGLLDGGSLLPRHLTVDERIAGLLQLERCMRGAAVLEAAESEAGSVEALVWTKFERADRWLFEVSLRQPPEGWQIAARGEDLLQTASEATITAICNRPCSTWSFEQFSRTILLVPIRRETGQARIDEATVAVWGQVEEESLAAEIDRHKRAGGRTVTQEFLNLLRKHLALSGTTDIEVVLMPGLRPIVLYARGMSRRDLDAALISMAASAGIGA